ncbi:MAG: hypothetical protein MH321_06140 [Leptospiraceae bacterium]|nr:hypothetical protein [Leptospiraceae bacterium]
MNISKLLGTFSLTVAILSFVFIGACSPKTDTYDPTIGLYGTEWIEEQRPESETVDQNIIYFKPDEKLNQQFFKNRIDPREFAKRFVLLKAKSLLDAFESPDPDRGREVFAFSLYKPFLAAAGKKIGVEYSEYDRGYTYTSQEDIEMIYTYIRQNLHEKNSFCNFGQLFYKKINKVEIKPYSLWDRVLDPKSKSHAIQTNYDIEYFMDPEKGSTYSQSIRFRVYFLIQGDHEIQISILDASPADCLYE